jgi:uracil-DNA glycosylase family 4
MISELSQLYQEIEHCQKCDLAKSRTRAVPGEGPEHSRLFFLGEAPGWHEDQQGRPFVGPAGQFLDSLLTSIGLKRKQVYIGNVIKCRPPANRDPLPSEIESCCQWLDRQLDLIHPKMVVCLGRFSMAKYFPGETIGKIHGKAKKQDNVIYYAMYHPAAALHQGNLRKVIEADMLRIPQILAQTEEVSEASAQPQQLSLFG